MIKSFCHFIFVFGCISVSFSQELLTEIAQPVKGDVSNVQVISSNDTIFLSYLMPLVANKIQQKLILPDGTSHDLNAKEMIGKSICGVAPGGEFQKHFYFLEQSRNSLNVKMIQVDLTNNKSSILPGLVELSGQFLGSHMEGNSLLIYTFEKNKLNLKVTRLHGLDVTEEKSYGIAVDLSDFKKSEIRLFEENEFIGVDAARAQVKIILRSNDIAILIDDPFNGFEEVERMYKTSLITINKTTGKKSFRVFPEFNKTNFCSTICGQYVFRIKQESKRFELQVFLDSTGKETFKKVIVAEKKMPEPKVYVRFGAENTIHNAGSLAIVWNPKGWRPFLMANQNPTTDQFTITWGNYNNSRGVGSGFGLQTVMPIAALTAFAITTLVKQLNDGPGVSIYFHLQGDPATSFDFADDQINSMKEKIDRYEIKNYTSEPGVDSKNYFDLGSSILSVYREKKSNKLTLVKFRKEVSSQMKSVPGVK